MRGPSATKLGLALLFVIVLPFLVSLQSVRCGPVPNKDPIPIPTVRIQPQNAIVRNGTVFSVNVIIENIPADPGMAGVEFKVSWDPTVLNVLNMTEVMFHNVTPPSEWSNIWAVENEINNTVGFVFYAYTWQDGNQARNGGYSPISGNYTLATITLEAMEVGSTTLNFSTVIVGDPSAEALICSPDLTYLTPLLPSLIIDGNVRVFSGFGDDVAVTDVTADSAWVYQGFIANISVTLLGEGDFDENVTVTVYYNGTEGEGIIGAEKVVLNSSQVETLTFTWDTTGVKASHSGYNITAVADISPMVDSDPSNNILQSPSKIQVRILGDVNGDGNVDIYDAMAASTAFGSHPGYPNWNDAADVNGDGTVNIFDVILMARNFGKTYE